MLSKCLIAATVLLASTTSLAQRRLEPDPPITCDDCAAWNAPLAPFRLFGNSYYVGVAGLSSILLTSDQGLILLDGALPQSAALIDANIRTLGFRTEDVKLILGGHAHYDHAGGIAALQRLTGAVVVASADNARVLEQGEPTPDDPQHGFGRAVMGFPAVKAVRRVADGEVVRLGDLAVTAHLTPGHMPGSTTWTWRSCEGARCLNLVYADSLTAVSAPGFRFTGDSTHPSRIDGFRASIAKVAALPCDIVVAVHPAFTNLASKLKQRAGKPAADPFIDPQGCRAYAADALKRLEARVAEERK